MAKKNNSRRGKNGKKMTFPIAIYAGLTPGIYKAGWHLINNGPGGMAREVSRIYTGYDLDTGRWDMGFLKYGTFPILIGAFIHALAQRFGINKAIGRAGIPWIRI